jgi:hypothetical protein
MHIAQGVLNGANPRKFIDVISDGFTHGTDEFKSFLQILMRLDDAAFAAWNEKKL